MLTNGQLLVAAGKYCTWTDRQRYLVYHPFQHLRLSVGIRVTFAASTVGARGVQVEQTTLVVVWIRLGSVMTR